MKPFTIVVIVVISLLVLAGILLWLLNKLIYSRFKPRYDGDLRYQFLSMRDYPNLRKMDVNVMSSYKAKLNGGIFSYKKDKYKGVIIFYHGLYSGYLNYLNVINYFANDGFIVVAFDMLANMSSEGTSIKGMPVGDKDNKLIIEFVKKHPILKEYPLFTLGHSWGGHLALTSLIHDDSSIKKAAALSPYNSNVDNVYSLAPILKMFAPLFYLLNFIKFGHESSYSVVNALTYSSADILIYTGELDHIVHSKYGYLKYLNTVKNNNLSNVTLKHFKDRGHFIYSSKRSEEYFVKEVSFPRNEPIHFERLDYSLINELNLDVLKEISEFFSK